MAGLCHYVGVTTGVPRIAVDVDRQSVPYPVECGLPRRSGVDFRKREDLMTGCNNSIHIALLASSVLATTSAGFAAEVTSERLINANREPHNWLMTHRTYDGQRFSPLARITKDNVKNLKLAYAVPLGGGTGNELLEATPLVEDGFLYITDAWGVLYKIDVSSRDVGRTVLLMEPQQRRPPTNRGPTLCSHAAPLYRSPAPTIRRPTTRFGAPATPCPCSTRSIVRAPTSTPTA